MSTSGRAPKNSQRDGSVGQIPREPPFLSPSPQPQPLGPLTKCHTWGAKRGGQRFFALGPCWDSPLPSCANGGALPFVITTLFNWAAPACVRARVCRCLWEGGTLLTHGAPGGGVLALCPPTGPLPQPGGGARGGHRAAPTDGPSPRGGGALTGCETARPGSPHDKGGGAGALISASRPGDRPGPRPALTAQRPRPVGAGGGPWATKINCPIKLSAWAGGGPAAPGDAGGRIMKCAKS